MLPVPADAIEVALLVARAIESVGGAYFIGGSVASSFQGEPRATNDIDIVLELPSDASPTSSVPSVPTSKSTPTCFEAGMDGVAVIRARLRGWIDVQAPQATIEDRWPWSPQHAFQYHLRVEPGDGSPADVDLHVASSWIQKFTGCRSTEY